MHDIPVMLMLAFFCAAGVFMTMAACFTGQTVWPLVSPLLAIAALLPICGCDLVTLDDTGDMPSVLADTRDQRKAARSDVGWFLCGIWLTCAWICPLLLARHAVFDMRIAWFASIGTWGLIGTASGAIVFFVKGSQTPSSSFY
jgi:hypothetical protein